MLVVAHLPEREAVAPQVPAAPVLRVEPLRVAAVDAVECLREGVAEALDDEVVVVRHQAEHVRPEPESAHGLPELREELAPVVPVEVDPSPLDAARRHVPDAVVRERGAREPSHRSTVGRLAGLRARVDELERNRCTSTCLERSRPGTVPGRDRSGRVRKAARLEDAAEQAAAREADHPVEGDGEPTRRERHVA